VQVPVTLLPERSDTHARGHARLEVAHEDVVEPVRVARDEHRRLALERDELAVGGQARQARVSASCRAGPRNADLGGGADREIADEDVLDEVVSFGVSVVELLANTMKRPSGEIVDSVLKPLPCTPSELTLTSVVTWFRRSRRKTSAFALASPATKFDE